MSDDIVLVSPDAESADGCSLYRHFDADGELLYVGIAICPMHRNYVHQRRSLWFQDVMTIAIEWFPSRADAALAERRAIEEERPRYNRRSGPIAKTEPDDGMRRLTVYLPDELDERLRDAAEARGQTLSVLVTRALEAALERSKPAKDKPR